MALGTAATVWMAAPAARAGVHVVAPGETLSGIATRYGTTVEALARRNGLSDPGLILAGQRLRVPSQIATASVHVVARGETLSSIATRYGTTLGTLARVNRIRDVDLIFAGDRLRIPPTASPEPFTPRGGIEATLEREARRRGVRPSLVKAVAWKESGWRQDAESDAGAVGVMQVLPQTADYVNGSLGAGALRVRSARDNVRLGVTYLDHLLDTMPSEGKALAAYLSGPGNVGSKLEKYQRDYVEGVKEAEPRF